MSEKKWIRECAEVCTGVNLFTIGKVQLFVANTAMDFPEGLHSHEEYEFMMPKTESITSICNGDMIVMQKGYFMPFNCFDIHGQQSAVRIDKFICLSCSNEFLNSLAKNVFNASHLVFKNISFKPSANLNYLLGVLIDECNNQQSAYQYMQDSLINLIFIEVIRCSQNNIVMPQIAVSAPIKRAAKYLEEHYNLPFNLEETAKVAKISKYYFLKLFRLHMGVTPKNYLTNIKMERAKSMIAEGSKNITEIAYILGYSTQSHFCMLFNKYCGITPLEYKKTII